MSNKNPHTRSSSNTQTKASTTSRFSDSPAQPTKRLTFAAVKAELGAIGVRITPPHDGDYRVALQGGDESSAYYTNDLADALGTGHAMKEQGATVRHLQDYSATCDDCGVTKVSVTPQGYCLRCASKRERATVAHQEATRDTNRIRTAREDRSHFGLCIIPGCTGTKLEGRKYCAAHQERANGQTLQEKITEQREAQPADLQRIQTFDPANCPNFAALAQIEKHADNALAMPNWNQDELISALAVIAQTAGAAVATHQAKIAAYRVQDLDGAEPDMERDRR